MPHGSVVPAEFQRRSSYGSHHFRVSDAWWRPYRFMWTAADEVEEFPRAALCRVAVDGSWVDCLFPEEEDAGVFESVLLLAAAHRATARTDKFLAAFRGLEGLRAPVPVEIRAIRHSLAHSATQLRDPLIVDALRQMFGGAAINFRRYPHKREFYRWFGELLVLLDCELAQALLDRREAWLAVERGQLLAPFREEELGLDRV